MQKNKVLVVLLFLLMASLACYSDSPLWVFGVTEVPPTSTFLPTPDSDQYPAKLNTDQLALAPRPSNPTQPFFFLTRLPEELVSGVRNASGSCDYGASLEILYIGQEFENLNTTVYVDDIVLTGAEDAQETLFDFEAETDWTLSADLAGGQQVGRSNNVNFSDMAPQPAEGEEPPDVENNTYVMTLNAKYQGDVRLAGATTDIENGDWSNYSVVSARVFVPRTAQFMMAELYITAGGTTTTSDRVALTPGNWTTVTLDVGDVENVETMGLQVGPDPVRSYYLVTCAGTVGWVNEERVAGPVSFVRGQSAQTKAIGLRGETLPPSPDRPTFAVHEGQSPPVNAMMPTGAFCDVGEVVDIIDISAVNRPDGGHDIWYSIYCPFSDQQGWVTENRLFGPLVLPAVGGIGIVEPEFEEVTLTESAGLPSDENATVGTCLANQVIETIGFQAVETEVSFVPYYLVECGDTSGWLPQEPLIEIPYVPGELVIAIGEEQIEEDEVAAEDTAEPTDVPEADEIPVEETEQFRPIPVRTSPSIELEGNLEGECPSGTVVRLGDVQSDLGLIFYETTCVVESEDEEEAEEISGWIEASFLPDKVTYETGTTLWFVEPSLDPEKRPEEGFSLQEEPSKVAASVGQCELFTPVEITGVGFAPKALRRLGFRLYYQITCPSVDGEEISGWVELDLVNEATTDNNPNRPLG